MPTVGSNFVVLTGTKPVFSGSTTYTPPIAVAKDSNAATEIARGSFNATIVDKVLIDLSLTSTPIVGTPSFTPSLVSGGYPRNGSALVNLVGTTAVNLDLTNLATNATSQVGDPTFALWNQIVLANLSGVDLVVSPGASNPARLLLSGTSPTITVPANSVVSLASLVGIAVDSAHKNLTITPTAGGSMAVSVGGSIIGDL
jgi:hypothetical protein